MSEIKDPDHTQEELRKDELAINTIRTLSMDAVQAANSGHPGTPMALAPVAYCLWNRFLRFDPQDPIWPNRDRFVLSNGHASMLLYSLLHLAGVKAVNEKYERLGNLSVTLDDIKNFRQLESKCPGHPEYRWTSGIETTTGPLGQGVSNSVGMAIGGLWMQKHFNRPGFEMFNHHVYAICGDGDMMEGVSSEAASVAGHLKLSNLCWIYDNNRITIEGSTDLAFTEDIAARFMSYGWNVIRVGDANDLHMLDRAYKIFLKTHDRPTFIIVDSHIAWGSPHKQDTSAAHGEPLGEGEIRLTKKNYGWPENAKFLIPDEVYSIFKEGIGNRSHNLREEWISLFDQYKKNYPKLADDLFKMQHRQLPDHWDKEIVEFPVDPKGMATRVSSGKVLNQIAPNLPWLIGGAADLSPSTKTYLNFDHADDFEAGNYNGSNFHFGVREHAMGSILNGLSLTKIRPFGAGFLIFSDYMRPPIRLAALMEIPVIYIFTHDSIGLGEDGPTHQPVEQISSLRAIPGLTTIRPCDANEVVEAWRYLIPLKHEPTALILSRQDLPTLDRSKYASAQGLHQGAYILADPPSGDKPELILIGTGSEIHLCLKAYEQLTQEGVKCRVVSMPSWEIFEKQDIDYKNKIFPIDISARISVEQAAIFGWERYVGLKGRSIGMTTFGASAPLEQLLKKFGFTVDHLVKQAKEIIQVAVH
ncbi:MAG: transketolase [Chlamydiia bacterium]|nr:transketolase [Chlamydiia bacterium]